MAVAGDHLFSDCSASRQKRRLRNEIPSWLRQTPDLSKTGFRKSPFIRKHSQHGANRHLPLKCSITNLGPFGELIRATGILAKTNPFRWGTRYQDDETDIVMYPGRPYLHERFITMDPAEEPGFVVLIGENIENRADSANFGNLYRFVCNNPVNSFDSLGFWPSSHSHMGELIRISSPLVHQISIARAIPDLSVHELGILNAATVEVDQSQGTAQSFQHAMRDGLNNQAASSAQSAANRFVKLHLKIAQLLLCSCNPDRDEALHHFGMALHTIQDATSPAHTGFQPWNGDGWGHKSEALAHVRREDYDPGASSNLDKATKWFWGFFTCPDEYNELPQDFFSNLGSDPAHE